MSSRYPSPIDAKIPTETELNQPLELIEDNYKMGQTELIMNSIMNYDDSNFFEAVVRNWGDLVKEFTPNALMQYDDGNLTVQSKDGLFIAAIKKTTDPNVPNTNFKGNSSNKTSTVLNYWFDTDVWQGVTIRYRNIYLQIGEDVDKDIMTKVTLAFIASADHMAARGIYTALDSLNQKLQSPQRSNVEMQSESVKLLT